MTMRKGTPSAVVKGKSNVGDEMIAGMKELIATMHAGGMPAVKKHFTVRRVRVAHPPALRPQDVKAAREKLNASQPVFAGFLGVSPSLVKAWEQGLKTPQGPVRLLIADMGADPVRWAGRLSKAVVEV
jgi:DNA-binding transcriptional regulator YiaG